MIEVPALREVFVHVSAVVEADAAIGAGTKIGSLAHRCDLVKARDDGSCCHGTREGEVHGGPSAVFTDDRPPGAQNPVRAVSRTLTRGAVSISANSTDVWAAAWLVGRR